MEKWILKVMSNDALHLHVNELYTHKKHNIFGQWQKIEYKFCVVFPWNHPSRRKPLPPGFPRFLRESLVPRSQLGPSAPSESCWCRSTSPRE